MNAAEYHEQLLALPYRGPTDREWAKASLDLYCDMLRNRVHFAQAAYRDAEFPWILGDTSIGNPNGEVWEPRLGRELADTLTRPVGQWFVYFWEGNPRRKAADAWLSENAPGLKWIPDRPFGRASELGLLGPFFRASKSRRVCIIGPSHLRDPWAFGADTVLMEVPPAVAWMAADDYAQRLVTMHEAFGVDLFLIAAGSAAALIVSKAWPHVKDRATLIDIGATLDPYCGVFSRNLTRTEKWQKEVMPMNLP